MADDVTVTVTVNGVRRDARVDGRTSLLELLREVWDLRGTKRGCDHGDCGACTVLIDDRPALACLTLAPLAHGKQVTTIDGGDADPAIARLRAAFVAHDALQCGFCTPGQIMAAAGLLKTGDRPDEAVARAWLGGNLCRCAAYPQIRAAVVAAGGAQ
ncbi:MAG: (2Fe-2S)-binding protein [Gemmatimonadales bacterium]